MEENERFGKINKSLTTPVSLPPAPESNGRGKGKTEVMGVLMKNPLKNDPHWNTDWKNPETTLPTIYKENFVQKNYVT